MGNVFSNIGDTFEALLDPVTWISLLSYTILFTFYGLIGLKKMPYSLIVPIMGLILFTIIHCRRCKKITGHQFAMAIIHYITHRIIHLILSIFPLTRMLRYIPFIGNFAFCIFSIFVGFIQTSLFYICSW